MEESQVTDLSSNQDEPAREYVAHLTDIGDGFMEYIPPIILGFGTCGNLLVIVVMLQPKMKKKTSSMYLCMLAISDIIVLFTGLLRRWLVAFVGYDIRTISDISCKLFIYLLYVFSQFDSWILCGLTIERLVAVTKPLKVKIICSRIRSAQSMGFLLFVFLLVNCHFMWMFGVQSIDETNFEQKECYYMTADYGVFYDKIYSWVDFVLVTILPSSIIIIGNIILVTNMQSRVLRDKLLATPATSDTKHRVPHRFTNATIMLIAASIMFVSTTTPLLVMSIGEWNVFGRAPKTEYEAWIFIVWQIVNLLYYSNNAFNFAIYCLSAPSFRKELKLIFSFCCQYLKLNQETPVLQNRVGVSQPGDDSLPTTSDTVNSSGNAALDATAAVTIPDSELPSVDNTLDKHDTFSVNTRDTPSNNNSEPISNNKLNNVNTDSDKAVARNKGANEEYITIGPNIDNTTGLNCDTIGPSTDTVGSNYDTIGPSTDTVGSNCGTTGSTIDTTGSNCETIGSNINTIGSNCDTVGSNIDTVGSNYGIDENRKNVGIRANVTHTEGPNDDCLTPQPETDSNYDNSENVLTIDFDEESISSLKEDDNIAIATNNMTINYESEETQL